MNWLHIIGALLMLSGFLTVFENFWVALLLFATGAVVYPCGINKAAAIKREEFEERWRKILYGDPSDPTDTTNTRNETE